jgi:hypothetical protein
MNASALLLLAALVDVVPAAEPPNVPLTGRFGLLLDVGAKADLPGVGLTDATYRSVLLVDIKQGEDGKITQRHSTCDVVIDQSVPMVDMLVPAAAVQSLKPRAYGITMAPQSDGSWSYGADLGRRDIGFVSSGKMPTTADDAGVIDPDKDGEPGVTLRMKLPFGGLDVYVLQRDHAVLRGRVMSPDLAEGAIEVKALEQQVLGTSPQLGEQKVSITPKRDAAKFSLFRVDDDTTCAQLKGGWQGMLQSAQGTPASVGRGLARQTP